MSILDDDTVDKMMDAAFWAQDKILRSRRIVYECVPAIMLPKIICPVQTWLHDHWADSQGWRIENFRVTDFTAYGHDNPIIDIPNEYSGEPNYEAALHTSKIAYTEPSKVFWQPVNTHEIVRVNLLPESQIMENLESDDEGVVYHRVQSLSIHASMPKVRIFKFIKSTSRMASESLFNVSDDTPLYNIEWPFENTLVLKNVEEIPDYIGHWAEKKFVWRIPVYRVYFVDSPKLDKRFLELPYVDILEYEKTNN